MPLALSFLDPNADWANLIKCLETSSTDSLEQSTSPTSPATAEIQNNFTAAQASNQNDICSFFRRQFNNKMPKDTGGGPAGLVAHCTGILHKSKSLQFKSGIKRICSQLKQAAERHLTQSGTVSSTILYY